MSVEQVLVDIATGNFSAAEAKLASWWSGLQPEFQALVTTLATAEGQILQGLVKTAASDVISGGLTTASFVTAGKAVESQLVSQNITLGTQTVFAALNAAAAAATPNATAASTAPADTPTGS